MRVKTVVSEWVKKLMTVDINNTVQLALTKVTLMVQNRAKELSPYDTWTLRRSITSDFAAVKKGITVVWSPVPYAAMRHFVNNKNPQTLRYLERWFTEQADVLRSIIFNALKQAL